MVQPLAAPAQGATSTQVKINIKIIHNGLLLRLVAHHCCLYVGEWVRISPRPHSSLSALLVA
jgi:hypothetical protein